jgi:hypothetical protein
VFRCLVPLTTLLLLLCVWKHGLTFFFFFFFFCGAGV